MKNSPVLLARICPVLKTTRHTFILRLTRVSDGTNSATYTYLANSPLVSQITFKENTATRMTTVKKYDFLNRLTSIVSTPSAANTIPSAFAYQYNDANQRIRMTTEDGSFWIYDYDKLGQVISGKRYWSDGTPVAGQQYEYGFDDIGNRTTTKEGGDETGSASALRASTYALKTNGLNQYDTRTVPAAVEIIGSAKPAASVTVDGSSPYRRGAYFEKAKSIDNSSVAQFPSITVQASLSGSTDTTSGRVFVPKTPESYSYDADGNLTQDGRWTYVWDAENRLTEMVCLTNIPTESKLWLTFGYDSQGRRVQKTVAQYTNSAWSLTLSNCFVYDGWNNLTELNATNNTLLQGYFWGLDLSHTLQRAGGIGGLIAIKDADRGAYFGCSDANGNVTGLIKTVDGSVSGRSEYGPFMEELRNTGSAARINPWRGSTKRLDEHTMLLYYGHRYYSSRNGRWLSRDPIEESGEENLYGLVRNSPTVDVDPVGLYGWGGHASDWQFVRHYLHGSGIAINLRDWGLDGVFWNAPSVQNAVQSFEKAMAAAALGKANFAACYSGRQYPIVFRLRKSDSVVTDVTDQIFSVGRSMFDREYWIEVNVACLCSEKVFWSYQGWVKYSIKDRFADPLDIGIEPAPNAKPYDINWLRVGLVEGGGYCSGSTCTD